MSSSLRRLFSSRDTSTPSFVTAPRENITISRPSKGLDLYSYVSTDPRTEQYAVKFEIPGKSFVNSRNDNFSVKKLEVEGLGIRSFTGRFQWTALRNGQPVASGWNDINALTGKLERGTMLDTKQITPIILQDVIIVYGFYDAGPGEAGLPNRHQCYVTITPLQHDWMKTLAPPGTAAAQRPFSRFVLAAPHDPGMHDMQTMDAVMSVGGITALKQMQKSLPQLKAFKFLPDNAVIPMLPNIIYGLAYTQKKTIKNMLLLGARYFEWRPAKLVPVFKETSGLPDKYYFTHGPIPGMATDDFLADVVSFLNQNANEVVVLHFRNDGIAKECHQPTPTEVNGMLNEACAKSNLGLKWGGGELLSHSISSLRSSNTRLICVNMAGKYDSYDDKAYATLTADPIIARLNSMNTASQGTSNFTILQCQATSTNITPVVVYSVLTTDAATSCLTATKALLDRLILPWIRDNALARLQAEKTVVIMNDFIDGATVDLAIKLSKQRLDKA